MFLLLNRTVCPSRPLFCLFFLSLIFEPFLNPLPVIPPIFIVFRELKNLNKGAGSLDFKVGSIGLENAFVKVQNGIQLMSQLFV